MTDIMTENIGHGEEITLCAAHAMEECHRCCMSFTEMNEDARERFQNAKAAENGGPGPGYLPRGTKVRCKFEKVPGRTIPDIVGKVMAVRDLSKHGISDVCYVIQDKKGENHLADVYSVHEEWTLEGVTLVQAQKLVKRVGDGDIQHLSAMERLTAMLDKSDVSVIHQ